MARPRNDLFDAHLSWRYAQKTAQFLHSDVDVELTGRQYVVFYHSSIQYARPWRGERGEGVERQSEERERVCKERLLVLHVTDR